jgi:bacterioferritin-associated ferredoxin
MNAADQRRANQQAHADRLADMYERTAQRMTNDGRTAEGDEWRGIAAEVRNLGREITWRDAVNDGRYNVHEVWKQGPVLSQCPTCNTNGRSVYVAADHSLGAACKWMMANLHRCAEHDELLLPTEDACPTPGVPGHWVDVHNRYTGRQ